MIRKNNIEKHRKKIIKPILSSGFVQASIMPLVDVNSTLITLFHGYVHLLEHDGADCE